MFSEFDLFLRHSVANLEGVICYWANVESSNHILLSEEEKLEMATHEETEEAFHIHKYKDRRLRDCELDFQVTADNSPDIFEAAQKVCNTLDEPMPAIYLVDGPFMPGMAISPRALLLNGPFLYSLSTEMQESYVTHETAHFYQNHYLTEAAKKAKNFTFWSLIVLGGCHLTQGVWDSDFINSVSASPVLMLVSFAYVLFKTIESALYHRNEFYADRVAAAVTSPDTTISLIHSMDEHFNPVVDHLRDYFTHFVPGERTKKLAQPLIRKLCPYPSNGGFTHPTHEARIVALQKLKEQEREDPKLLIRF